MPYIAVKSDKQETDHRELKGAMMIGRAPDCDIQVRDILLSRHHCQIETTDFGWRISDLKSKNGTIINNQQLVESVILKDNDVVRVGRCVIVFHAGKMEASMKRRPATPLRAADPSEALAGTLAGFTLLMPGEGEEPPANQPTPQPRPREPASYERPEVRELLTTIASSSWDSIYAEASRQNAITAQAASAPEPAGRIAALSDDPPRRKARPKSPVDLTLQAVAPKRAANSRLERGDENLLHVSQADALPADAGASTILTTGAEAPRSAEPRQRIPRMPRARFSRRSLARPLSWIALVVWVALVATLFTWWSTQSDGASANPAGSSAAPMVQPAPAPVANVPVNPTFNALQVLRSHVDTKQFSAAVEVAAMNAPVFLW